MQQIHPCALTTSRRGGSFTVETSSTPFESVFIRLILLPLCRCVCIYLSLRGLIYAPTSSSTHCKNPTIKILGSCRTTPQQNPTPISYIIVYELTPFFLVRASESRSCHIDRWQPQNAASGPPSICVQRIFPQPPVIRRKSGTGGARKSGQMTGPIKPDKGP